MDTRGQHGNQVGQKDEYGTPIQQTDAYGKPLSTHEAGSDTTGAGYGTTTGAGGGQMRHPEKEHHGGGILHGLGGTNSSSEKLPGGRKTDENGQQGYGHGQDTTGTGYGGTTTTGATGHNDPEKKGFVEKIKERIPGGDKTGEHGQQGYGHGQATTGTGTGYGGTTPTTGATGHYDPEKKGFVEKVKERIPGGDKTSEHGQHGHGEATPGTGTGYGGTPMTTRGATGHNDPEKKGFVEKIKERIPGGDKTGEHGQHGHGHGQATTGTGTGYGGTTTTGATGRNDPEKRGFVEKIKERIPGGDKTGEHGQQGQGHGHGQATTGTGTGYGGTTTTGATGHNDPEKRGFVEKVKEKIPGGDKTGAHGQQGYEHGQATTGAGHGGTTTTTGAVNDPEKKGFMEKIKEKLPGGRN